MKVNLELEKRIGIGRARVVIIKPKFADILVGLNFTFKFKTLLYPWNMYVNLFCIKYIIKFIFNDSITERARYRAEENNYRSDEATEYIMKD